MSGKHQTAVQNRVIDFMSPKRLTSQVRSHTEKKCAPIGEQNEEVESGNFVIEISEDDINDVRKQIAKVANGKKTSKFKNFVKVLSGKLAIGKLGLALLNA